MVSLIQEYASSGPAVGSISFDFATKSDGMALTGQGTVKPPRWSNCSEAFLAIQNWTGQLGVANRMCKDAFDWPTKGRAWDGPGLNSAWWPDVNCLAIQTQMAQRPRHQCQGLLPSLAVMSKPLQDHCRQELFRSQGVSRTWASQAEQRQSRGQTRGVEAVRILSTTIEA